MKDEFINLVTCDPGDAAAGFVHIFCPLPIKYFCRRWMASPAHGPHTQTRSGNLPTEPLSSSGDGRHYKNPAHAHSRTIEDSRFRALTSGRAIFQFPFACTCMLAGLNLNRQNNSFTFCINSSQIQFNPFLTVIKMPNCPKCQKPVYFGKFIVRFWPAILIFIERKGGRCF
jgi:hypothetical protein